MSYRDNPVREAEFNRENDRQARTLKNLKKVAEIPDAQPQGRICGGCQIRRTDHEMKGRKVCEGCWKKGKR